MYRYSNGVNLIAGGEKHRVYVKKSPTGVGKGVKGHVMVNHPTEDKGKWDTIDLTEKAGAKTVEEGKAATRKWHRENPYVSGSKSVKQYRGDENLPEAKNGMKKNCGCKHTKSKYKYQAGTKGAKSKALVMEDLYSEMGDLTGNRPEKLLRSGIIVDKNVNRAIIRANDEKNNKVINVLTAYNRDVNAKDENLLTVPELDKNPKARVTPTGYYTLDPDYVSDKDKKNYHGNVSHLKPIKANGRKAPIAKLVSFHETYDPKVRDPLYGTNKANVSFGCVNCKPKDYKYAVKNTGINDTVAVFDSRRPADRDLLSRYKAVTNMKAKGASALTIPEGSAIVTANGGKNKLALKYYKAKKWPELNKIIDDMPEDNVDKKQSGDNAVEVVKNPLSVSQAVNQNVKLGFYPTTVQAPAAGYPTTRTPSKQREMELEYEKNPVAFEKKYGKIAASLQKERMQAVANKQEEFIWSRDKKPYKSGYTIKDAPPTTLQPKTARVATAGPEAIPAEKPKVVSTDKGSGGGLNLGPSANIADNLLDNLSQEEIRARRKSLAKGVEKVPEHYLKLNRYKYASKLPETLQEIRLAEQVARENARNVLGGDAARYLAVASDLSAARAKRSSEEISSDVEKKFQQEIQPNVQVSNTEVSTNRDLKDYYAELNAKARAAYDAQQIELGKAIDSSWDKMRKNKNLQKYDEQLLEILKNSSGNYKIEKNGDVFSIVPNIPVESISTQSIIPSTTTSSASFGPLATGYVPAITGKNKGSKKLKTYKRI